MDPNRALRRPARGGVIALAATTLTMALLAGCTGSSSGSNGTATTPGATGATASVTVPPTTAIKNDPTARKDVVKTSCVATSSGWQATGTVANSKSKDSTYTIVVSFTTKQSTVLARGTTKVTVKGGATKHWTASASFAKTKGVVCVLRGVSES